MDFIVYLLCIFVGIIIGALGGLRFTQWAWSGKSIAKRDEIKFWIVVFVAWCYIGARRFM